MRRAQASQVFIWALAAILMTLLLLFGYRAINSLTERGEQVNCLEFQNNLRSTIESTTDYGAERRATFRPPAGYKKVCFIKTYGGLPPSTIIDDPIIKDNVESQIKDANVFLVKEIAEDSFSVGDIDVEGGYLCVSVTRGEIKLRIEGFGRYAKIHAG